MTSTSKSNRSDKRMYSELGYPSGIRYLSSVRKILDRRSLPFRCDAPTEAHGNCFNCSITQQLHRPEVRMELSETMVNLSEDYHNLRLAVVDFIETLDPASRFYSAFDQGRVSYICSAEALGLPSWEETLEGMKLDGTWFEDSWIQYTAWFLQRDIFLLLKKFY